MSRDAYFALKGGLDTATPVIEINPGFCEYAQNWEVETNGYGYREHEGCERFDGQPLPSSDPDNAETLRAAISAVPGSGPVRGIWIFENDVYAFRDTADGLNCEMHKATSSGWTKVTTPALSPGGKYEFQNYNFYATSSKKAMYGVDGVNKAFEYDGTTFTQITTGVSPDTPNHIAAHQYHLFLGFPQGAVDFSPVGNPVGTYSAIDGAGELGVGDGLTALMPLSDEVMAIYGADSIHLLYGTGSTTFQLKTHSHDAGAYPYSVQPISGHVMLGPLGVRTLSATQAYGNFAAVTKSRRITEWLDSIGSRPIGSVLVRKKNHYRLYFQSGTGTYELSASAVDPKNMAFMPIRYPFSFNCVCSGMVNGEEHIYAGADDGMVYRLDSGNSWDGSEIKTLLRLPWNHQGSPNIRKHFRECYPEIKGTTTVSRNIRFSYRLEYGDRDYPQGMTQDIFSTVNGQYWGVGQWNNFLWNPGHSSPRPIKTPGSGTNIALLFATNRTGEPPITLSSIRLQYDPRRHI